MSGIKFLLTIFCCISLSGISIAQSGTITAGLSKVNITSPHEIPLHDSLYARVLVLQDGNKRIAFIAVDQGIYTSDRIAKIGKEQFGLDVLFLSSSHTHSSGKSDETLVISQLTKALKKATDNMFPAKLAAGHRKFPQLGFNRLIVREDGHSRESWFSDDHYTSENPERIPFGPVDPEVGVIKVEDMQGNTKGIVMNYACHADIVCSNYEISADFPGVACKKVEEAFGNNAVCLFVQGGAGNIESLIISSRRSGPDDSFKTDYRTIERVGSLLAYEAIKLTGSLAPSAIKQAGIRYMNDSLQFTGRFMTDALFDVHISTILLNDNIAISTCPGEPFVQLQLEWKQKMRDAGSIPFLFGYTWYKGTWPNYIPDIKSAAQGGYGADQDGPTLIAVGSGEAIMNKHFENFFRLNGLMRKESGPVGFKGGSQWQTIEITPESKNK